MAGECGRERAGGARKAQNEANWNRLLIACQKGVSVDTFGLIDAERTQFRVVEDRTLKGWSCRKLPWRQARPTLDREAQGHEQWDGAAGRDVESGRGPSAQWAAPRVMAVCGDFIIDFCSFLRKTSLAAANRHDTGHPETLVELPIALVGQ